MGPKTFCLNGSAPQLCLRLRTLSSMVMQAIPHLGTRVFTWQHLLRSRFLLRYVEICFYNCLQVMNLYNCTKCRTQSLFDLFAFPSALHQALMASASAQAHGQSRSQRFDTLTLLPDAKARSRAPWCQKLETQPVSYSSRCSSR